MIYFDMIDGEIYESTIQRYIGTETYFSIVIENEKFTGNKTNISRNIFHDVCCWYEE